MEFVARVLLYFTCLCFQDFVFGEDYAETGGLITFSPSIRGKPVEILWKHNGDKVVEYDGSETNQYGSFKDRVVIDLETGQLTIKKLSSQDSGEYQSDITINGIIQTSEHNLTVLDVLPAPRVTCEVNETSNLQELLCSVDYKTPLQYKWSGPNVIDHLGEKMIISEQQKNSDSVYSCTVKNEVSSKTAEFNLQDCVTGAAAGLDVILPVLLVTLLIFLIILAIFIYRKKKPREKKKDPENALSGATLPCQMRLISPNDSDKIQDEDNGSDNTGENEENTKLLNYSGNKEEQCCNENSLHTVLEEEITSSKPDEMQMVMQKDRHLERQDEKEEGQREKLEKGIEEKLEEKKYNAENNGKIPGEKKEENKEEKDEQNTASSEDTFPNQTGLVHQNGSDTEQDEDNRSDNTNEEKATLLKDSGDEEQRYNNDSLHTDVVEENASSKPEETLNQKLHESQEEEKKGEGEKPGNGNEKEEMSMDDLTEKLGGLNIHHTDNNDKLSEEKIKEGNKEQKDQQSTATHDISTTQVSNSENHKEETQKPEKRNESGETSAQQQNEGVKTEVTARNEIQQTTGANTQEEDDEEMKESDTEGSSPQSDVMEKDKEDTETGGALDKMENDQNKHELQKDTQTNQKAEDGEKIQKEKHEENPDSASNSEKQTIQNNRDAISSQNVLSADTDMHENKSVKSDHNQEDIETKAADNDEDAESLRNEGTSEVKSEEEDDHNGQRDKSSEPKQDMKENNDPPAAEVNTLLKDNEVKNPDLDQRKDEQSVLEDDKHETQSDNFQPQEHQSKQNSENSVKISEGNDTDSDL